MCIERILNLPLIRLKGVPSIEHRGYKHRCELRNFVTVGGSRMVVTEMGLSKASTRQIRKSLQYRSRGEKRAEAAERRRGPVAVRTQLSAHRATALWLACKRAKAGTATPDQVPSLVQIHYFIIVCLWVDSIVWCASCDTWSVPKQHCVLKSKAVQAELSSTTCV